MPSLLEAAPETVLEAQSRPFLTSFDSGTEHSLDHLFMVRRLVEQEYTFLDVESEGLPSLSAIC